MSTYLVEDETINRVVAWLYWESERSPDLKEKLEAALGIDTTTNQWYAQLGQAVALGRTVSGSADDGCSAIIRRVSLFGQTARPAPHRS